MMRPDAIANAIAVAACACALMFSATAGAQEPGDVGPVLVIDNGSDRLDSGTGGTEFNLALPTGATCPGDTAHDGYIVQSYMVPESVDPTGLTFDGQGPTPYHPETYEAFRMPLYLPDQPFDAEPTAPNAEPGHPGLIVTLPTLSFAAYPPGYLPVGIYNIGVACVFETEPKVIWGTQMEVVEDDSDDVSARRWTIVGSQEGTIGGDDSSPTLPLVVAALAAAALAFVFIRRRRPVTVGRARSSS